MDSVLRKSTTSYSNRKGPLSTKGPNFLGRVDTERKNSWPTLRGEFSFWYRTFPLNYNLCYFQLSLKIVVIYHVKQFVRPMQNILCKFCDLKNLVIFWPIWTFSRILTWFDLFWHMWTFNLNLTWFDLFGPMWTLSRILTWFDLCWPMWTFS